MMCPKCGSNDVNVQIVQEVRLTDKHHSPLWWLLIGWWWMIVKWLFLTFPALLVKIFAPKRQKLEHETKSVCVCQSCGYRWDVEPEEDNIGLFDRLVPVGSIREKLLLPLACVASFVITMSILIHLFA